MQNLLNKTKLQKDEKNIRQLFRDNYEETLNKVLTMMDNYDEFILDENLITHKPTNLVFNDDGIYRPIRFEFAVKDYNKQFHTLRKVLLLKKKINTLNILDTFLDRKWNTATIQVKIVYSKEENLGYVPWNTRVETWLRREFNIHEPLYVSGAGTIWETDTEALAEADIWIENDKLYFNMLIKYGGKSITDM